MPVNAAPGLRLEDRYEVLEKLCEGGMGEIYRVRHRVLDEIRIVKVMRPHLAANGPLRARFLREARMAIKLRHPNIAQLYDYSAGEDGAPAFMVMEYIEGATLEELLAGGPPPLALGLEIARQALTALGSLHEKGFVHRDISPDNIMLAEGPDGAPLVKLLDLGIAKSLTAEAGGGELTRTGAFLGKLRYSAPEQFGAAGHTPLDARSDLYSFGVVLYELLTGHYPIDGDDPSAIIGGHLFRPPLGFAVTDPAGRLSEGLRQVVLRALAKDPAERFQSAGDFWQELARFRTSPSTRSDLQRALRRQREAGPPAPEARSTRAFRELATEVAPAGVTTVPAGELAADRTDLGAAAPAPARRLRGWLGWGLAAVGVAGAVWAFLSPSSPSFQSQISSTSTSTLANGPAAAPPASAGTAAVSGTLVLDAAPWAELAEIRDGRGAQVAPGEGKQTPLVVTLPPGRYFVTLRHPGTGPKTLAVDVTANARVHLFAEFAPYDEAAFFRSLGW
jgi:tRNA A-37 threonylcarbamoyl transferase component Bud32